MLSRSFRIILIKIKVSHPRYIYIHFPLPAFVFQELFDCLLDLSAAVSLFAPKLRLSRKAPDISIHTVKELLRMLLGLFDSLTEKNPYDLVDVTNDKVKVSVKIR